MIRTIDVMVWLLALVLLMTSGCSAVAPGEKGVRVTFGKVQGDTLDEGYYLWVPFVLSTKSLSVRVQKHVIETSAASKDIQEVKAHVAVNWHIDPATVAALYSRIGSEEDAVTNIISPAVSEVLKAATAKKTAEEILTKRKELKDEIDTNLKERLHSYGILLDDISLVDVSFTHEFSRAVERKQIAEQEAKQAEYNARKAIHQAEAEINRARGQAEAQKLVKLSLTPEILQQRAIEKWNGQFPQVMGSGVLPFLNLNLK